MSATPYSRQTYDQLRAAAKRQEQRDGLLLAAVAVGLGVGQLGFIAWSEAHFPRHTAVAIEGGIFLVYMALVVWLLFRVQRHKRNGAPRCPQCGKALMGVSESVAAATGKCDACGGQVIQ